MGLYALFRPGTPSIAQLAATTFKVPLLFLLTLVVTFPSLYVFCALVNSRLKFQETARFILMGIVVNLALLASFGPITSFFTLSTQSYPFIVLLNVVFFAVSGLAGLLFVRRGMKSIFEPPGGAAPSAESSPPAATPLPPAMPAKGSLSSDPPPAPRAPPSASRLQLPPPSDPSRWVFNVWVIIFGAVGAQMGWILRPFIGSPELPFALFRQRQSNFFEAVLLAIRALFS